MKKNRYVVLICGMLIQFCAGIIYMWSVFKAPVIQHFSWENGAATFTSSIMLAFFVLGIVIGGRVQDKIGPRKVTITGSILISGGMLLTALIPVSAPWLVYVTYGILGGFGVGCVYTCTISTIQKWFPDRRGFATGMIVSAFGLSLVVFAPLAKSMLALWGVPATFALFGAGFLIICVTCGIFIVRPAAQAAATVASDKKQYATGEMLRTKEFYFIFASMFLLTPAYFILNPQLLSLGEARGLSADIAIFAVMITGIASAAGRLIVSWISDTIGRRAALFSIGVITLAAMGLLLFAQGTLYLVCCAAVAFAFGGSAGVYAAVTADRYGTKNSGMNFGCVMVAFGLSALFSPAIGSTIESAGGANLSFIYAAATAVLSLVCMIMLGKPKETKKV